MQGINRYREMCQKNAAENYLLDKYVFRHISIFLTIVFIKLKIKANTATFLSLAAALGSCYFLVFNTAGALITAALLIFAYYMLDHVDGELARYYTGQGLQKPSLSGHYFDLLVHRYSSNLMLFFMSLGVYRLYGYEWAVLLGFAACIGISSFPNVIAAQAIVGKIANDPGAVTSAEAQKVLGLLERKSGQVGQVRGGAAARIKKLAGEFLFFPGHVIMIIVVLCLDILFDDCFTLFAYPFNFRLLFLTGMALLFSVKTLIQGHLWIRRLKEIS